MTELRKANRRANLGILLILVCIGGCLATLGQAWWLSLLSFLPLLLAFAWYGYWSNKAWDQIERHYGRRMRPW